MVARVNSITHMHQKKLFNPLNSAISYGKKQTGKTPLEHAIAYAEKKLYFN